VFVLFFFFFLFATSNSLIQISINDTYDIKSVFTSVSQRSSRSAIPGPKASKSSKVTESNFSPRTLQLAIASKSHVRTTIIYDTPFPPAHRAGHIDFVWKVIKETANDSKDTELVNAFKKASSDIPIKKDLMAFVRYILFEGLLLIY
jgi:hypothetical protein